MWSEKQVKQSRYYLLRSIKNLYQNHKQVLLGSGYYLQSVNVAKSGSDVEEKPKPETQGKGEYQIACRIPQYESVEYQTQKHWVLQNSDPTKGISKFCQANASQDQSYEIRRAKEANDPTFFASKIVGLNPVV